MATPPTSGNGAAPGITVRRVIACSAERTLSTLPERDGRRRLVKVFESGSLTDAEREFAALRLAAGPGVVTVDELLRDPATGKPALTLEHLDGFDLEDRIAADGPLPASRVVALACGLVRVLDRLASLRRPGAPLGLLHGDVKPSNILLAGEFEPNGPVVHLLDFEHAVAAGLGPTAPLRAGFSGGTHGYAPPEAYRGLAPNATFDVFGLGRTLRQALTAQRPPIGAAPWPADLAWRCVPGLLRELVDSCQAVDPAERPTYPQLMTAFLGLPAFDEAAERTRLAIAAADFAGARASLAHVGADAATRGALQRLLSRRERLADRMPARHLEMGNGSIEHALERDARHLHAWLRRFPGDPVATAARDSLLGRFVRNCAQLPVELRALEREGAFGSALQRIDAARDAIVALLRLGRPPLRGLDVESIAPIHRAPLQVLDLAARSIGDAAARFEHRLGELQRAEAALDFAAARAVLDEVAASYGGASELTAMLKRRYLEFGYALGRIAGAEDLVAELSTSAAQLAIDLTPLAGLVAHCASSEVEPRAAPHGRGLLRSLTELCAEYPHVATTVRPAVDALRATLTTLTEDAWQTLARADVALTAQPIPIRPLQADLHRLERLDFAGMFVDLPERSRAELLDAIESARLRIDRARATRDRLARGAVEALDQGRLTTALFEMERVANEFDDDTARAGTERRERPPTGERQGDVPMHDRLAHAKQLKLEVEATMRRNHELAARIAELQAGLAAREAGASSDGETLRSASTQLDSALAERDVALSFLAEHVAVQRRHVYAADLASLRRVRFERAVELGAARCAASPTPHETAFAIARDLALLVPKQGWDPAELAASRQTIQRFHDLAQQPSKVVAPRRRGLFGIAVAGVLAVVALGWGLARGAHSARREADARLANGAPDAVDPRRVQIDDRAQRLLTDIRAAESSELVPLRARLRTLCDEVAAVANPGTGDAIGRLFRAAIASPAPTGHNPELDAAYVDLLASTDAAAVERSVARTAIAYARLAGTTTDVDTRDR